MVVVGQKFGLGGRRRSPPELQRALTPLRLKSTIINTLTASVSYFTDSSSTHQLKSIFTLSFLISLSFDGAPVFDLL